VSDQPIGNLTWQEHYRRAERLLALATEEEDVGWKWHRARVRMAHVHALLAHAGAVYSTERAK